MRSMVMAALISAALTGTAQAQAGACSAFEDINYRGRGFDLAGNQSSPRSKLDNRISSFKVIRGCQIEAFDGENYRGAKLTFDKDVPVLPSGWNDRVSSWRCVCEKPHNID